MHNRHLGTEAVLAIIILIMCIILSISSDSFLTTQNIFDLLNNQAVNIIFAIGLVVVLIAGGIDISFTATAAIVQYVVITLLMKFDGGGNWLLGMMLSMLAGAMLGIINGWLIYRFRIVSIIVTIGTFNIYFGLLMYFTGGVSIYDLPDWLADSISLVSLPAQRGTATLYLPVAIMVAVGLITILLLKYSGFGRTIYAFGSNPEAAHRSGVRIGFVTIFAYSWLGLCAGIAGLMQVNIVQQVVPNALIGQELTILAAVVLGGASLGGGRGSVIGAVLGVLILAVVQNGLDLLGVTPYAFRMIVGIIILVSIMTHKAGNVLSRPLTWFRKART